MIEDKKILVYPSSKSDKPVVHLNTFSEEGEQAYEALQSGKQH